MLVGDSVFYVQYATRDVTRDIHTRVITRDFTFVSAYIFVYIYMYVCVYAYVNVCIYVGSRVRAVTNPAQTKGFPDWGLPRCLHQFDFADVIWNSNFG